jgi:hypothetical protein
MMPYVNAQSRASLPQETKECSADSVIDYDGVTFQNIPLGISFKKFRTLCSASLHELQPAREIEEDGVQVVYKASGPWPIGKYKWTPSFCFVEDKGVYRLTSIRGTINDFEAFKGVTEALDNKYGKHSFRNQQLVWKIGSINETAVMMDDSLPAWLYFHDVSLLKLGLAKRQRNAPGL